MPLEEYEVLSCHVTSKADTPWGEFAQKKQEKVNGYIKGKLKDMDHKSRRAYM